jgi:hypothetical protein
VAEENRGWQAKRRVKCGGARNCFIYNRHDCKRFRSDENGKAAAERRSMRMEIKKANGITGEQVEGYRKATAALREGFLSAKAAQLQIFAGGKARIPSSDPASLLAGVTVN